MTKLISDYAKVEISNKVKDFLRMYHSSSWNSEPYHQNQNPAEGRYCTLKSWTNTIMNRSGVTEFRQPLQVQSHLEVPRILVQLGHIQRT